MLSAFGMLHFRHCRTRAPLPTFEFAFLTGRFVLSGLQLDDEAYLDTRRWQNACENEFNQRIAAPKKFLALKFICVFTQVLSQTIDTLLV